MIAAWMLYCALCALGLSLAAVLAERMLAGRGPVRHVWIVAVLLSVVVPAAAFRFGPRAAASSLAVAPVGDAAAPVPSVADSLAIESPPAARPTAPASRWNWRAVLARADQPLAIVWLALSSALIAHFVGGMIALAWMRRWWRRDVVQGVDVLVSEATGPALVGALSPAIVVPEWTLGMDAAQVELMLRHEQEHRRARDGQLLTVAHFALIAMPWNVALWWQLLRLRVAVELDCDARVLRDADARRYGDLLLEVARPRPRLMLMGATAFAERASQLERRIRAIGRRRATASRLATIGAAFIGVVVVTAAWVAPRPPVPAPTAARPISLPPAATLLRADSATVRTPKPAIADASSPVSAATRPLAASQRPGAKPSPSIPPSGDSVSRQMAAPLAPAKDSATVATGPLLVRRDVSGSVVTQPALQLRSPAQQQDSTFEQLFAGITLTPDQEAKARELVNQLETAQALQMANTIRTVIATQPLRQAIQAQADSGLEALLTNDADRVLLHGRFVPQVPGGRVGGGGRGAGGAGGRGGRSASLVGDSTFVISNWSVARGGAGGGGVVAAPPGVGRGGGRGRAGGPGSADAVELTFRRFFDGITLTPQQESDARTIIGKMQADLRAVAPPPPSAILARRGLNQFAMSPESAAAFASLLSNDADRATLQSHIVIEVLRTIETPPR